MKRVFDMSDLGLLSYYLGIEVLQGKDGIMLTQKGYAEKILKASGMEGCNSSQYPMEPKLQLTKDEDGEPVNATMGGDGRLVGYSDSSYNSDCEDRRGTTGVAFYYSGNLITWASQKQKTVALSSCEAEYMAATAAACQGLWLRNLFINKVIIRLPIPVLPLLPLFLFIAIFLDRQHDQSSSSRVIPDAARLVDHHKYSMVWLPAGDQWRRLKRITR
uniref:Reverse transcriptase Ty1/copia-type domain-containing protein n=1 Tax=Lactuca sativa TaxID=4236 RepID=A0A9R1X4M0_LACSA|nr:hypothetical protein LSAT_V11C700345610 [Lactuca sativa]